MLPLPEVPPLLLPDEPPCEPLPLVSPMLDPLVEEPLEPVVPELLLPLEPFFLWLFFFVDFLWDELPWVVWSDCELALVPPVDELPLVWSWAFTAPHIATAREAPSKPFSNLFIFMSIS
jgi:signal-induced proliferation-associated 1 like protein 3